MQNKTTKKAPLLQVNSAAKVKPTKAAKTPTKVYNESYVKNLQEMLRVKNELLIHAKETLEELKATVAEQAPISYLLEDNFNAEDIKMLVFSSPVGIVNEDISELKDITSKFIIDVHSMYLRYNEYMPLAHRRILDFNFEFINALYNLHYKKI